MNKNNLCWIYILIGGCFEILWAVAMDYSEGFTDIRYDVLFVIGIVLSMVFLSKALAGGLPMGTAYAVWVGIGAVGTMVFSFAAGLETVTLYRVFFLMLIISGIIGMQVTSGSSKAE